MLYPILTHADYTICSTEPGNEFCRLPLNCVREIPRKVSIGLLGRVEFIEPNKPDQLKSAASANKFRSYHKKLSRSVPVAMVHAGIAEALAFNG